MTPNPISDKVAQEGFAPHIWTRNEFPFAVSTLVVHYHYVCVCVCVCLIMLLPYLRVLSFLGAAVEPSDATSEANNIRSHARRSIFTVLRLGLKTACYLRGCHL